MQLRAGRHYWLILVALISAEGCTKEPTDASRRASTNTASAEAEIRNKFAELRKVLKEKDTAKVWDLLSRKSRTEAEAKAKEVRSAYEKAKPEERAQLEKDLGLPGAELAKLTAKGYLATTRCIHKAGEIAESTITKVTVGSDSATVYYDEPDGDHEKLHFEREDGQWKAWMPIPKSKKS